MVVVILEKVLVVSPHIRAKYSTLPFVTLDPKVIVGALLPSPFDTPDCTKLIYCTVNPVGAAGGVPVPPLLA